MDFHCDVHDGDGPFLLLVHGILSSRVQWKLNLAALQRVARPVVIELWGHGRSPSPVDPQIYHPEAYVAAFERLRERLGAERWLICGQSMGAALTLRYSFDYPERVIAQVFTNSASALADAEWVTAMRAGAVAQADAIEQGGAELIENMPMHPARARRLPPEMRDALVAEARSLDPCGLAHTLRHTAPESSVRDRVVKNRVPTLLVCGERETRFNPHREFAERHMPHLEVVGVDAGHAVNIEAAEPFDLAVTEFVDRHRV